MNTDESIYGLDGCADEKEDSDENLVDDGVAINDEDDAGSHGCSEDYEHISQDTLA